MKVLEIELSLRDLEAKEITVYTVNGDSADSYNDIGREEVGITTERFAAASNTAKITLAPHSVNVIVIQ